MKKFLTFILSFFLLFATVGCKDDGKKTLRVNEVTHSIFYAPFYVAIEKGFFDDEDIKIDLTNGGGSDSSMTALLSNSAEIALLGPETGIYTQLGGVSDAPIVFAQLTKRDGSFLIGRYEENNFQWKNIENKEIIAGRRGGMPAMTLQYICNNHGLFNGQNLTLNYDVQFSLTAAAFEGGTGDYVTMFEPTASEYQRAGKGYIVASLGEEAGLMPYTCFMAKKSYFDKNKELIEKFTRAVYKAIKYIKENDVEVVATCLEKQFPSTSLQSIIDSIESYKRIDAWTENMSMTKDSFDLLQTVMMNAGELEKKADFSSLVDNSVAEKIYAEIF